MAWFSLDVVKLVTFSLRRRLDLADAPVPFSLRRGSASPEVIQRYLRDRKMTSLATYKTLMKAGSTIYQHHAPRFQLEFEERRNSIRKDMLGGL